MRTHYCAALTVLALCTVAAPYGHATPLQIENNSNIFRDFRGPSNVRAEGDRMVFSVKVNPTTGDLTFPYDVNESDFIANTSVMITSAVNGAVIQPPFVGSPAIPDEFATSREFDPVAFPTGDWTVQVENGLDFQERTIPGIGDVGRIPLVRNVTLDTAGTLRWELPPTSEDVTNLRVDIIDVATRLRIAQSPTLPLSTANFDLTTFPLQRGIEYAAEIRYENLPSDRPAFRQINRSSTFKNFTLLDPSLPSGTQVSIPTVTADGVFTFDNDVEAGVPIILDPSVAVGYDYAIGDSDTVRFASVRILSNVGDGVYDLFLHDSSGLVFETTLAFSDLFSFDLLGVERFRIAGIETSAGISPTDPLAFLTEVTFTGTGAFTGTMTPLTASVPEPATLALFGVGVVGLAFARRRRGTAISPATTR